MTTETETDVDLLRLRNADGVAVQDEFYTSWGKNVLLLAGVGVGKTTVIVYDAFDYAITFPGSRQVLTEPTFDMLRDVLVDTMDRIYGAGRGGLYNWTTSAPVNVTFANSSVIMCRAADSVLEERRRGTNLNRVLMDEITLGDQ